jgi:hypothetical protein
MVLTSFCVAVESSSLAYSISLDLLHIVGDLNVKKNTFYIADYLRFPGLNFGAIFSVTRCKYRSTWKRHTNDVRHVHGVCRTKM